MTILWQIPALVVALLTWLNSPPTSLVDAARHEAVRRQLTAKSVKAVGNDTLPFGAFPDVALSADAVRESNAPAAAEQAQPAETGATPQAETKPPQVVIPGATLSPPNEPAQPAANDEQAWRSKLATIRNALVRDQAAAVDLQTRVSVLQREFTSRDDPAQRAMLGQDLGKALADLDRAKAKAQEGQAALEKFREDARRAGVPPGWVR